MSKFLIKGTGDQARTVLKNNLDAQNAAFDASFNKIFKPAPVAAAAPAAKPSAQPAAKPVAKSNAGWALGTDRNRPFKR